MTAGHADRRPMDVEAVAAALRRRDGWRLEHVLATGSTNDDLASRVRRSGPEDSAGTVLVTEEQTAGRGRSGRQWSCPAGAGLMFSAAVDVSSLPPARRPWTGVALGLAVITGFRSVAGVQAGLKWPNDVMVDGNKCGGILAEAAGDVVIVGAGLNISLQRPELPRPDATSLLLAGAARVDRNFLLAAVLDEFGRLLSNWREAGGDVDTGGLRPAYLAECITIGSRVRLELPGGGTVLGTAVDVDADGAIVVDSGSGRVRYSAGDVVHLRPAPEV
jgi:BirA family biotin operon repressor/biotin-[acetyl-CoA-carboxylase] ligase